MSVPAELARNLRLRKSGKVAPVAYRWAGFKQGLACCGAKNVRETSKWIWVKGIQ